MVFYAQIMKRLSSDSLSSDSSIVSHFHKWKTEVNQECKTLSWLDCKNSSAGAMKRWRSSRTVDIQYQLSIEGNIQDHAHSDRHIHAMLLLRKSQAQIKGLEASPHALIAKP